MSEISFTNIFFKSFSEKTVEIALMEPMELGLSNRPKSFVYPCIAQQFLPELENDSVDLFLIDPPYYGIVSADWDNQWSDETHFVEWLYDHLERAYHKLKPTGSLLIFGGIGKDGCHPFFKLLSRIESYRPRKYYFRNMITWKKRRAYGKSHDYLFCREEIVWYSKSPERTAVTFNIPLLDEKRGYAGFNKKYPAKSEFKRVSNVWDDIPELMRPNRACEKPLPLLERLIATHSNPGDLVVDFFAGTGSTGDAALRLGRRFVGCEAISYVASSADKRCRSVSDGQGLRAPEPAPASLDTSPADSDLDREE